MLQGVWVTVEMYSVEVHSNVHTGHDSPGFAGLQAQVSCAQFPHSQYRLGVTAVLRSQQPGVLLIPAVNTSMTGLHGAGWAPTVCS